MCNDTSCNQSAACMPCVSCSSKPAHLVKALAANGAHIVLQGGGPVVGVDDMAGLFVQVGHPVAELVGIGQCGRQEHLPARNSTARGNVGGRIKTAKSDKTGLLFMAAD